MEAKNAILASTRMIILLLDTKARGSCSSPGVPLKGTKQHMAMAARYPATFTPAPILSGTTEGNLMYIRNITAQAAIPRRALTAVEEVPMTQG